MSDLTIDDRGAGRPVLLLHGGAGPRSVLPFAQRLAGEGALRAITPTHPGFSGTPRPAALRTPADLAGRYVELLGELGLDGVTVVGFSIGGWIAAELAVRNDPRVDRVVIVDGVGIQVDGHPLTDVSTLTAAELAAASFHAPERFAPDPTALTDAQRAESAGNLAAVLSYGGTMADPGLAPRLREARAPALVLWGESDGIAGVGYGRAYAAAFADARFELLPRAGHMPQLEQPEALAAAIVAFAGPTG